MPRVNIMLAKPYEPRYLANWSKPFLVQPKLDGVRCLAEWNGYEVRLKSSQDNLITSVTHINEHLAIHLQNANVAPRIFDGELFAEGVPFELISGIARTKNADHPNRKDLQFHIFDMQAELHNLDRALFLTRIFLASSSAYIKLVETIAVCSEEEAFELLRTFISRGYEGIMFRNPLGLYQPKRTSDLLKFKPTKSDTYEIIGYVEEEDKHGTPKGTLGAFICRGSNGEEFSCGSGLKAWQRAMFWQERSSLVGRHLLIKYQELSAERKVPRFPIFIEVV